MARGSLKPKLRDLSKKILSEEETGQLLEALNNPRQPPVLTAIYGASIVEHDLEQLLRPRIGRNDSATWELLTSEAGPLNTLHQKILIGTRSVHSANLYEEILMLFAIYETHLHTRERLI
jgi:hypothetical protein